MAIGIVEIRQFALGTTHQEIADAVALAAHRHRAKIVVDTSNNSAFVSLLAPRFGRQAANVINPTIIVNAAHHAAAPSPMPVSVGTMRIALPRWTLSKRELIETTAMELDNRSLRIAKTGDWELLRDELQAMEQTVRESGTVSYAAPEGHHDDLVVALSLCVFGARRLVAMPRRFARGPQAELFESCLDLSYSGVEAAVDRPRGALSVHRGRGQAQRPSHASLVMSQMVCRTAHLKSERCRLIR